MMKVASVKSKRAAWRFRAWASSKSQGGAKAFVQCALLVISFTLLHPGCSSTVSGTDPGIPPVVAPPAAGGASSESLPTTAPEDSSNTAGPGIDGVGNDRPPPSIRSTVPPPVASSNGSGASAGGLGSVTKAPPEVDNCPAASPDMCTPVQTAEHLPGRVLPDVQMTVTQTITPDQIYATFQAACGRCHQGDARGGNGGWY